MPIKIHIEVEDAEGLTGFNVTECADDTAEVDAATLAALIGTAQHKANALLPSASPVTTDQDKIAEWFGGEPSSREAATTTDSAKGVRVGTAYIEVRPDFSAFDGGEFEQAVRRVVEKCGRLGTGTGTGRAFRP
jgi:hypothetical protein